MFDTLPTDARTVMDWGWEQFKPFYDDLLAREITAVSAATWLADWTRLDNLVSEAYTRLHLSHMTKTQRTKKRNSATLPFWKRLCRRCKRRIRR
ncbi:MAG: hypothetical protein H6660_15370 [Ardenticatenaceae bacterium]|nr:hypothetical protein [Ardenticatenaceae bacterium]